MSSETLPPFDRGVLATLVHFEGSSSKRPGTQMWIDDRGAIVGSVTIGGCVDARVIEHAPDVLALGRATMLTVPFGDDDAWALGLSCAGTVHVLMEPVGLQPTHPVRETLAFVREQNGRGVRTAIAVTVDDAQRIARAESGATIGSLGHEGVDAAAVALLQDWIEKEKGSGMTKLETAFGARELFVEVHVPGIELIVFGASHVAVPLIAYASQLGWRSIIVDSREAFATRARFPNASELLVGMPSEVAERLKLGRQSAVVLLSHDYKFDLPVLRKIVTSSVAYVGCLGSRKRGAALRSFLAEQGIPAEALERIHVPIGLNIGANSAEEIALSIAAEILAVLRQRSGASMRV